VIENLRKIAYDVREAIKGLESRAWKEDVGMGADGTPTLRIDRLAEDAVLSSLESMGNPYNVLSEERGFLDFGRDFTLVLDPIDGTYNAINSIPIYSISMALAESAISDVKYAFILNLATGEEFYSERSKGAYRNGRRIKTRGFEEKSSIFSVMLGKRAKEDAYKVLRIPERVRSLGSTSLEIAYVAAGFMDLYYYSGTDGLRVIDIAAASLILREAGGEIYDENLDVLDMGLNLRERSSVIAVGDEKVLGVLR